MTPHPKHGRAWRKTGRAADAQERARAKHAHRTRRQLDRLDPQTASLDPRDYARAA